MLQNAPPSLHSNLSTLIDYDHVTLDEAKSSLEWPQWLEALNDEYSSLRKHNVFGPLVTNLTTKHVRFKLIFTKKQNAQGHVVQYKVHLVAQGIWIGRTFSGIALEGMLERTCSGFTCKWVHTKTLCPPRDFEL